MPKWGMLDFLLAAMAFIVALGGVLTAIGLLAKSPYLGRPLRWLWHQNVSEPVGEWHEKIVTGVIDSRVEYLMHHRNDGSSLLDLAEAVEGVKAHVDLLVAHDAERDRAGMRYPAHGTKAAVDSVQQDVITLLEHDAERDTEGKRYGD